MALVRSLLALYNASSKGWDVTLANCACAVCTVHQRRCWHVSVGSCMHRYWTLIEAEARAWQVPPQALPSDARERADLVALASGNLKAAQVPTRLDALQPLQLHTESKGNTLLLCF